MSAKEKADIETLLDGPISRRAAFRQGILTGMGLLLGNDVAAYGRISAAPEANRKAKAKAVIQIWMWGGPCHLDTFDPKPEAGYDYCGPLNKPIATNVQGIRICQLLP